MRVLIVSEGPSELSRARSDEAERSSALVALVRKLTSLDFTCEFDRVQSDRIHTHRGKGQGYFKRAVRWLLEAKKRGVDALILVIDEDHITERRKEIEAAQEQPLGVVRRALGLAIRTFDAWMLADEQALTQVFGATIQRQPDPETIDDPKSAFNALLQRSVPDCDEPTSDLYRRIAAVVDIAVLESRCPKGFGAFAKRVRALE